MNTFSKKILITGGAGMLAADLYPVLEKVGAKILATGRANSKRNNVEVVELNITIPENVKKIVSDFKPDWIINCAAYTKVDDAEKDYDTALAVNAYGAGYLAEAARESNAKFVHISTDYLFGGNNDRNIKKLPYKEEDFCSPCGIYGHSKKFGEELVLKNLPEAMILRTSWLHGINGPNFVDTMIKIGKEKGSLKVVDDQVGTPTWTGWLAEIILKMMTKDAKGIFHASSFGSVSRFDQAKEIFKIAGLDVEVLPQSSKEASRPAPRPAFSAFDVSKIEKFLGEKCISWQDGIAKHISFLPKEESVNLKKVNSR